MREAARTRRWRPDPAPSDRPVSEPRRSTTAAGNRLLRPAPTGTSWSPSCPVTCTRDQQVAEQRANRGDREAAPATRQAAQRLGRRSRDELLAGLLGRVPAADQLYGDPGECGDIQQGGGRGGPVADVGQHELREDEQPQCYRNPARHDPRAEQGDAQQHQSDDRAEQSGCHEDHCQARLHSGHHVGERRPCWRRRSTSRGRPGRCRRTRSVRSHRRRRGRRPRWRAEAICLGPSWRWRLRRP